MKLRLAACALALFASGCASLPEPGVRQAFHFADMAHGLPVRQRAEGHFLDASVDLLNLDLARQATDTLKIVLRHHEMHTRHGSGGFEIADLDVRVRHG